MQVRNEVVKYDDEASSRITSEIEKGWIKLKDVETSTELGRIGEKLGLHKGEMSALSAAIEMIQKLVKAGLWISPDVLAEIFLSLEE